jgi:hypothetical protein
MTNPKLKERRQRSWLRGEARKKRNREANEARRKANDAQLAFLDLTRTKTAVERRRGDKTVIVYRPDSPQRTIRLAGLKEAA